MPKKPKRPCSYAGCPNLTDGQYCEEHEAAARRQYNRYGRPADSNRKYGRAWKRIRDRYAAAQGGFHRGSGQELENFSKFYRTRLPRSEKERGFLEQSAEQQLR